MPPAGYKRSRALWDETRRPNPPKAAVIRAILYELQPIRFSRTSQRQWLQTVQKLFASLHLLAKSIPKLFLALLKIVRVLKPSHWLALASAVVYYYFVRFMHELLLAGPAIISITGIALVFTIGLGDDRDSDGLSAYAVFNRGFERLLGSVDAENLVAQHVGGGLAGGGGMMGGAGPRNDDDDDNHRGRRQRQMRRGAANAVNQNEDENHNNNNNDNINNNNRARKSGKKARRRDLAQRRELQNQRQAAEALGLNAGGVEEQIALQQLVEEQEAAQRNEQENQ